MRKLRVTVSVPTCSNRLNVVELRLPPLRRRPEDVPYLTAAFVRECATRLRKPLVGLTAAAERLLVSAQWEGNVRELRNVVERACILAEGDLITEKDLAVNISVSVDAAMPVPTASFAEAMADVPGLETIPAEDDQESLATIERDHIMRTLRRAGGNKKAAAKMLGLSRRALSNRRLERHQLDETIQRRKGGEMVMVD